MSSNSRPSSPPPFSVPFILALDGYPYFCPSSINHETSRIGGGYLGHLCRGPHLQNGSADTTSPMEAPRPATRVERACGDDRFVVPHRRNLLPEKGETIQRIVVARRTQQCRVQELDRVWGNPLASFDEPTCQVLSVSCHHQGFFGSKPPTWKTGIVVRNDEPKHWTGQVLRPSTAVVYRQQSGNESTLNHYPGKGCIVFGMFDCSSDAE